MLRANARSSPVSIRLPLTRQIFFTASPRLRVQILLRDAERSSHCSVHVISWSEHCSNLLNGPKSRFRTCGFTKALRACNTAFAFAAHADPVDARSDLLDAGGVQALSKWSRTYSSGEAARFCVLDLAPEAPWRCPTIARGTSGGFTDVNSQHEALDEPPIEDEPESGPEVASLLDAAESIVNAVCHVPRAEVEVERRATAA